MSCLFYALFILDLAICGVSFIIDCMNNRKRFEME